MTESAAVLFANEAFYQAFAEGDAEAMEALWAEGVAVCCVHPGWNALLGREAVIESWRAILTHPEAPPVMAFNARVQLFAPVAPLALVTCNEVIGENLLAASNLFVHERGVWRLCHHHSGPIAEAPEVEEAEPGEGTMH
jgi:hypothetical protein